MSQSGRPPKPEHLRRSRMVPVRLTQSELEHLKRLAESAGVSVSDLMREGARFYGEKLKGKGESRKETKK